MHTYCPENICKFEYGRLTINIPETKSSLVKQILKELGVVVQPEKKANTSDFRKKLANGSVWSDDDLKVFEAASCIVHELPIVTLNKKHFKRIEGLKILR